MYKSFILKNFTILAKLLFILNAAFLSSSNQMLNKDMLGDMYLKYFYLKHIYNTSVFTIQAYFVFCI